MKEEKEKILEEVMENETYKKAKEILEKFDPDRHKVRDTDFLSFFVTLYLSRYLFLFFCLSF